MPNYGLQEFSVQEATNVNCFTDWNYEILDLSVDETDDTSSYITGDNPAKKMIYLLLHLMVRQILISK